MMHDMKFCGFYYFYLELFACEKFQNYIDNNGCQGGGIE